MATLTIKGTVPQLDGEYDLDLSEGFTKQEYFLMKQKVGIVAGDLAPGSPIDMNVLTAFGVVMLTRADRAAYIPLFMETNDQQTDWDFSDVEAGEDDALPPPSEPAANEGSSGNTNTSGDATANDSENPDAAPSRTGTSPLDTGRISDPVTSAA